MYEFYLRNKKIIDRITFIILITLSVYAFFTVLFTFLAPFFFGLLIALLMEPLIRLLTKRFNWRRWIASLVSLLLFIAAFSSLGVWLISTLVRQIINFVASAPAHAEDIASRMEDMNLWLERLTDMLPETWVLPDIEEIIITAVTTMFGGLVREQGMGILVGVPDVFVIIILALVSAYFFMADRENIFSFVARNTPLWIKAQVNQTKSGLSKAVGGYFRAQYILMTIVGIISIIGLLLLGNPYALLLGVLFAILDFFPILGAGTVLVPWAIISALMGNINQAIALAIIYVIITITRQVLQPKILGAQMGAHPLASLMSIFIGFRIFGLLGFIIGPSLLMIIIAVAKPSNSEDVEKTKTEELKKEKKEKEDENAQYGISKRKSNFNSNKKR